MFPEQTFVICGSDNFPKIKRMAPIITPLSALSNCIYRNIHELSSRMCNSHVRLALGLRAKPRAGFNADTICDSKNRPWKTRRTLKLRSSNTTVGAALVNLSSTRSSSFASVPRVASATLFCHVSYRNDS